MKTPLIVFLLILAIIIFIKYFQGHQEKPAGETGKGVEVKEKKEKKKFSWSWAIVIFLTFLIGYWVLKLSSTSLTGKTAEAIPFCSDQKVYILTFDRPEARIQLQSTCWSGWIKLPNQTNFRIANPGRLQMLTWDGRYLEFGKDTVKWLGQIPFVNFRLKGEGEARVFVERKV